MEGAGSVEALTFEARPELTFVSGVLFFAVPKQVCLYTFGAKSQLAQRYTLS